MAAWLSVYCARSVGHVTASDLRAALDGADLYTVAEGFGIEDDAMVDEAMARLRIEPATGSDGARFELRYGGAGGRPVVIHVWDGSARVRAERDEALGGLEGVESPDAERVRAGLGRAIEVVGVELGGGQLEGMAVVLAGQVAEAFASAGAGLIRDQDGGWWAVEGGVPVLVLGSRNGGA